MVTTFAEMQELGDLAYDLALLFTGDGYAAAVAYQEAVASARAEAEADKVHSHRMFALMRHGQA